MSHQGYKLDNSFYSLTQNVQGALFYGALTTFNRTQVNEASTQPDPPALFQIRREYAESPGWLMVQVAEFMPEPVSVEKLRVRAIWSAPGIIKAMLELMASEKWLDRRGDDYFVTDEGRRILANRSDMLSTPLSTFAPMTEGEIARLEALMRRLLDASMEAGDPPGNWCLRYSHNRTPGANAALLEKVFQYCADFNAYRDDAHMAALRDFGGAGKTWEAFSFVDDSNANSAAALFDQLAYRGYAVEDWQESLDELTQRGWVSLQDGGYVSTDEGQRVRTEVEMLTNKYFFAPWKTRAKAKIAELHKLLTKLQEASTAAAQQ